MGGLSPAPRGQPRIYLGVAAGVGKTYAMLCEGRQRAERGAEIVVAFAEPHGRPRTRALLDGLEMIPRATLRYRGDLAAKGVIRHALASSSAPSLARQDAESGVRLTPTEWHLLEVLLRNPGKLLSHKQLLSEVWGPGYDNAAGNLRLYMAQLRRKIEPDPARPRWLITEPGMGYRYQPPR